MNYKFVIAVCIGLSLRADGLADLKNTLEKLNNRQPIRAQVKGFVSSVTTEDKTPIQSSGSMEVVVDLNSNGVRIQWSQEDIERVRQESARGAKDPNSPSPLRGLMNSFSASLMDSLLAYSDNLNQLLSFSQLLTEISEQRNGQNLRKLTLKINRPMREADRKSMKSYVNELIIWIDENGVPVESEEKLALKGSRFLIGFERNSLTKRLLRRTGDRLIVVEYEDSNNNSISIMGSNKSQSKFVVTTN